MKTAALIIRLIFVWWFQLRKCSAQGLSETAVQSKCRDRYLWIHVVSGRTPRFEAVDDHGVHSISQQLASQCGYTIRTSKMDGFTIFRASYYSCFTQNQNDEVFTFRFNVMVRDAHGHWTNQPVSAVCSGFTLSDREIICEEDYMEVNVNRQSTCEGGDTGQTWQAAFAELKCVLQAQRMVSSVWQLMFLRGDEQVYSMSVSEAKKLGYSLTASAQRLVLRAQYNQPQAEIKMIEEVPVEVIRVSLFFKKKLMVLMLDMSMACAVNSSSFKDGWLLLEVPQVMSPLVGEGVDYQSNSIRLGVDGMLLEESLAAARGIRVVQHGQKIQIGVPFGTEGGYRKSLVVKNSYKETYMIFLLYEHIFSMLYEDGSSIDTRHRLLRKLGTPLICHIPFTINQTVADNQVFSVYLGNIPVDVVLEDLWINGKQLQMSEKLGYSIKYSVHNNGSKAYQLQLPFKDSVVQQMYLGEGVVQYSIDINFTLTIMPQRESYYHQTTITARVFDAFPPEITAQCLDRAIVFSVAGSSQTQTLWEVGVDKTPLTSELAVQRGYLLSVQNQKTVLEIPLFSIGYTYEEINLSNFYATFELLLRDPKSLAVQTSTSKRCLFKTQDMMVCSTDGTMTVVAALSSTWPSVKPERTTLLDPACVPKQTDGSRVLFEFKVDSCGTKNMVGDTYMVYENEIFHNRQLIPDGPNFISRDSNFKLTVRCFYPLSGVNRLSVDRTFRSEAPGFGLVDVFKSLKESIKPQRLGELGTSPVIAETQTDKRLHSPPQTICAILKLLELKPTKLLQRLHLVFTTSTIGNNKQLASPTVFLLDMTACISICLFTSLRKLSTVQVSLANVRPTLLVSPNLQHYKKPMVQPLNSASTVLSSQEHVANGVWEGKQVQTTDLDQTSTTVSPNQQMPLHNPVHSPSSQSLFYQLAGTKYDSALKNVQAAATPQVGARPPSFRTETNGPTFGKGENTGLHIDLHGLAGSYVAGQTPSGCSSQTETSIHQGIIRAETVELLLNKPKSQ
ncbi:Zona pellucida sperm-binding protein 2 ZP1 [Takifugu flavidus]|uniref:Zona pellucida sperm-binding protein 2 ZP1 n=1 Tax=Takifugu flavidus TaxID=433684 RepID=A0A5C6NMH3_9TELE|nr:Zona pellucida sperm-binding protein 2 ZP1 [Takifugu flavidus]